MAHFRNNDRERRMYDATCDNCGKNCQVPFQPTGSKPVLCNNCFSRDNGQDSRRSSGNDRNRGGSRRFESNSGRDRSMYSAVCDNCGKNCQVPFKPSSGKPIFCDDCFGAQKPKRTESSADYSQQFAALNAKLDYILSLLAPEEKAPKATKNVVETVAEAVEPEVEVVEEKPKAKKKVAKAEKPAKEEKKKKTTKKASK